MAGAAFALFLTLITAVSVLAAVMFSIAVPNELRGLCIAIFAALSVLLGNALAPVVVSGLSEASAAMRCSASH